MRSLVAFALAAASSWVMAQPSPTYPTVPVQRPATIQVTGRAKVSQIPDRVYIDIGVTTQAAKSEAAAAQNASRLSAVIAALKRAAGPGSQLTTTEYSVAPNYDYPRDGGTPTVVGYTVSNVVRIRLDDLRKIGPVIDAAVQSGSNNVRDISFALRDEQAPRSEALREAALDARQDAEALAGALGVRIMRVLSVSEESAAVRPIFPQTRQFTAKVAGAPATPVEAGTIDIDATVSLTVEVAPEKR